jgi:hypothetical protein
VGNKTSNSHALLGRSIDGQSFSGGAAYDLGFANFSSVATDPSGTLFGGLVGAATCKSVNFDSTPTTATFTPGNALPVTASIFGATHYIVSAGGNVHSATSLGGSWFIAGLGISGGNTVGDFATNGDPANGVAPTVIVLLAAATSTGNRIAMYSTDDGVTWTTGHNFGNVSVNISYSIYWGAFIAYVLNTQQLWTSPNGASWTLQRTVPTLVDVTEAHAQIACVGSAIALVVNHTATANVYLRGVAYTFDLGLTWCESYFGDLIFGSEPILEITAANGRLYAIDEFCCYTSGALESPPDLYAGS